MTKQLHLAGTIQTQGAASYFNIAGGTSSECSNVSQKNLSSTFFSSLPAPILTHRVHTSCLTCLLLNGEVYRLFRDDSGCIKFALFFRPQLSKELLTTGCFIPGSKDSVIICSVLQSSLNSNQSSVIFDSQISIYYHQKKCYTTTVSGIAIKDCIPMNNHIILLGHGGETLFYNYTKESLHLINSFSNSHEFAISLVLNYGKRFRQHSFTAFCRLLMLNVATTPLSFASSSYLFLLYPNGSLLVLSGLSVTLYALLQPHQLKNELTFSTFCSDRQLLTSRTSPIVKPMTLSVASGYIFVGFANGILSIYVLDQIKNDMSRGKLATQPMISVNTLDFCKDLDSIDTNIRTDTNKAFHKGVSALHPVYLWDTATCQSRPESQPHDEDCAGIYLTELSTQAISSTTQCPPSPFSHSNLHLLLAVSNSSNILLLKLFPQYELKLVLTYESPNLLQMTTVSITQILFLTNSGFTQALYAQLSNGSLFQLILPANILLYSALKPPPPKRSPTPDMPAKKDIPNSCGNIDNVDSVQDAADKPINNFIQPSRHPFVSSTKSLKKLVGDSSAIIADLFPYGKYYTASDKDTISASKHHPTDSFVSKHQRLSPLSVLLNDTTDRPPTTPASHLGHVARSLPLSYTRPSGPCFTNLLAHNSPLMTQATELNKSAVSSLEKQADLKISKAIPNEKIYHQVILTPAAPVRSRFVINFLPAGNPVLRLLDGTVSKPKPIIAQFNALLESSNMCPQISANYSGHLRTNFTPKIPQSSTSTTTQLRPPSPSQLRRSHLLRIELPMPSFSVDNSKLKKDRLSTYASMMTRRATNNSTIEQMLPMDTNLDLGADILSINRQDESSIDKLLLSHSEPHDLGLENINAHRCYTPFGPIESLSAYRHSDFCRKNGDLRLIYPHKQLARESEDSFGYSLNLSIQSECAEQEPSGKPHSKNIWTGSTHSQREYRATPMQTMADSYFSANALNVSPAKIYTHGDSFRRRWLSKYLNAKGRFSYDFPISNSNHRKQRRPTEPISFFVINLNDLFANPLAKQILKVSVSATGTSAPQPSAPTLTTDLPRKLGTEDTDRILDERLGYPVPTWSEEKQPDYEQDRRLLTSKSGVWESSNNAQNIVDAVDSNPPCGPKDLPINPLLPSTLTVDQTDALDNQVIDTPAKSLDSVPLFKTLPKEQSPIQDTHTRASSQERCDQPDAVPASSQLHDPHILIDESGNLIMYSTPISPILSDIIKDGTLRPVVGATEEVSQDSIDEPLALKASERFRRKFYDSQEHVELGISLDLFPHNKLRISHNKYDLLSICTYRGPLPQVDDETKRFLKVMEQRSRYHLDTIDPGNSFMLMGSSTSIHQKMLGYTEMYHQTVLTMSAQLVHSNMKKDRIQQLYREIIRRILNNIDRLCEQDCIRKITLGQDKYYSLKRQCVVDCSSSSTDTLSQEEKSEGSALSEGSDSLRPSDSRQVSELKDSPATNLEEHQLCPDVEIPEETLASDPSALTLDELNTSLSEVGAPDKDIQANNSFLMNTLSINDPSISNIDARSIPSPKHNGIAADYSSDPFKEPSKPTQISATLALETSSSSEHSVENDRYIGRDLSQRYVIHRDRTKVLFDIYAEDQEYSDTDPIYTEDNPKYVPVAFTNEQYKLLFHLDVGSSKRLRQIDISAEPSRYASTLDCHVEPQLWFMKTGYRFSPLEEDLDPLLKEQSPGLRNALSFQRVRTRLTLSDTAEHHTFEDMVSLLTAALPDGESSEEACIPEETPDDLNSDIFEEDISNLAYEDMTPDQKLKYLLNESYVDATRLYLGKTLDELGYFMQKRKRKHQQRTEGVEESIFDLMANGLGFTKPRMPDSYIQGEQIQKHRFDQAGGRLLSFTSTRRPGCLFDLGMTEPVNPAVANQFYHHLSKKQAPEDVSSTEPDILIQDYKRSYYYHNPLINMLQCYYLVRNYNVLNAYFSRHLTLTDKTYTRPTSAPSWFGKKRKEQSILDLWEETYKITPSKALWDSTLAFKRTSPTRQVVIDHTVLRPQSNNTVLNLLRSEALSNSIRYDRTSKHGKLATTPYIHTFFNTMRSKGIEYRQAIAEISKADLYSTEIADVFAKIYKIERLETEKHLKDLYDVANRTGNARLYGLCINVMLFRPYLKKNPFKSVLAGVNSLVDDDASTGSNSVNSVLSPRQPTSDTAGDGPPDIFARSSAASLLLELQEKRKKEHREKVRARALETNTKALMFELKAGTAVDISNIFIPFDMRFDYKDLRPGRCYYCAGVFIEIPFLPPYKFEKENDLEEEFKGFIDRQVDGFKELKGNHAHGHDGELEELIERANKVVNESVILFDVKFLYMMYPVLYTNFTELLLSKRIKRMDVNSDISDISKLISNFRAEEHSLEMDPLDFDTQEQQWKTTMSDSFCSLHASEVEGYENSKDQVATDVIAKVTDLDVYLSSSAVKELDQVESPLRLTALTQQAGQLDLADSRTMPIDKCDAKLTSLPAPLTESGVNVAELSPDNRIMTTNYRNIIDLQTNYVFETNYKYYEHITIQSALNNKAYRLGLMPIKAVIRDILFECLASLPPFARFIAKKLIEDGNVFRAEELQMLPFVLLQAQLLYRPARDLFTYLRHAMKKIHLLEIQKIQRKAAEEENLVSSSSEGDTLQDNQDSITGNPQTGVDASWRKLMYRPCSQLLDFDGIWGDKESAIKSNKHLFNYCALLLYHTRLAAGRTRQLMIWKLRQIAKRDKGGFQKGDAFAEVASKYNNIATSTVAHNNLVEAARFSAFYEATLSDFNGIVAIGRRASPVTIYLWKIKDHFVCLYEDFCLKSTKADEYVTSMRFDILEEMRREAQIYSYAVLRIHGYKYMDDTLLGIRPNSLLLVYPLSLIINIHTLYTMCSDLVSYMLRNKDEISAKSCDKIECSTQSESLTTKNLSSHGSTKDTYSSMALLFMMFVRHHVNRMRPGYSFLIYIVSILYHDVTETQIACCLYNLTLFELKLRMDNSYVVDWPRLTVLLGSFNAEMLAEWLEITFKNVYLTTRNAAKKDVINYLQKQQTMISALVSFVAHDENTTCLSSASICAKGEHSLQIDSEEDFRASYTTTNVGTVTEVEVDVPRGLIEGVRRLSSPARHESITKATDELLKMDRNQFVTDDMLERVQQHGKFAAKIQRGNIDAIRADLDFRMNELKIILDDQEPSSKAADYEITEVREERQADEMGERFIEYAISKQLTEKLRVIRRDLSPTSFRTDESMDLVTPMRELKEQCIKIESIKRQHELNEMLRLSSTESPQVENSMSSILKNAEETTHKLAQNVNDIRIRGASMSAWRNQIRHMLQEDPQRHSPDGKIAGIDPVSQLKGETRIRGVDYILTSDVQLPSKIQGTVRKILTPQPVKTGSTSFVKQQPSSTIPRRPYSILGHIQSSPSKSKESRKCSPPPPGSTIFSSDIKE